MPSRLSDGFTKYIYPPPPSRNLLRGGILCPDTSCFDTFFAYIPRSSILKRSISHHLCQFFCLVEGSHVLIAHFVHFGRQNSPIWVGNSPVIPTIPCMASILLSPFCSLVRVSVPSLFDMLGLLAPSITSTP